MTAARNGRPPGRTAGRVAPGAAHVEWGSGLTPCRRFPYLFADTRTALDRQRAAHACLHHCPQLDTCRRDRAQAPADLLVGVVFAGRLTSARGGEIAIRDLPSKVCPWPVIRENCVTRVGGA